VEEGFGGAERLGFIQELARGVKCCKLGFLCQYGVLLSF